MLATHKYYYIFLYGLFDSFQLVLPELRIRLRPFLVQVGPLLILLGDHSSWSANKFATLNAEGEEKGRGVLVLVLVLVLLLVLVLVLVLVLLLVLVLVLVLLQDLVIVLVLVLVLVLVIVLVLVLALVLVLVMALVLPFLPPSPFTSRSLPSLPLPNNNELRKASDGDGNRHVATYLSLQVPVRSFCGQPAF